MQSPAKLFFVFFMFLPFPILSFFILVLSADSFNPCLDFFHAGPQGGIYCIFLRVLPHHTASKVIFSDSQCMHVTALRQPFLSCFPSVFCVYTQFFCAITPRLPGICSIIFLCSGLQRDFSHQEPGQALLQSPKPLSCLGLSPTQKAPIQVLSAFADSHWSDARLRTLVCSNQTPAKDQSTLDPLGSWTK